MIDLSLYLDRCSRHKSSTLIRKAGSPPTSAINECGGNGSVLRAMLNGCLHLICVLPFILYRERHCILSGRRLFETVGLLANMSFGIGGIPLGL